MIHRFSRYMRCLICLVVAVASVLLSVTVGADESYEIFVYIDNIQGESTNAVHSNWVDVVSFEHSISMAFSFAGGGGEGKVQHNDMKIVKRLDKSSPLLNSKCCMGQQIAIIKLEVCKSSGAKEKIQEITFEDVVITSVKISATPQNGETRPREEVTFTYAKIKWKYYCFPGGTVETGWDVVGNQSY